MTTNTPFLRRWFVHEGRREDRETIELYNTLAAYPNPYTPDDLGRRVWSSVGGRIPEGLRNSFSDVINTIIRGERYMFECPPLPRDPTPRETTDYRGFLRQRQYFLAHHEHVADLLVDCLSLVFAALADALPQSKPPSPFSIPLIQALPEPREFIESLYAVFGDTQYRERGLFNALFLRMHENVCAASGRTPHEDSKKPWKHAGSSDEPLETVCETYLAGTPLLELFTTKISLKFTFEERFNHMHVVGGTGAGKTTLLENLILHDLAYSNAGLIIVDSQGDLIRKISRMAVFDPDHGSRAGKLVLVSPKDVDYPPALNVFDVNQARLRRYDTATKEQVTAGVIQTFDYLFAGLLGADLTAKQSVFFRFVARLMLALPEAIGRNATILDMLHLLEDAAPYAAAIETLPPLQRNFFNNDFPSSSFKQTKEQIRYRLHAILENPTIARLFTSERTKLDLFDEMNKGSIVLVDTAQDFLKDAHSHFGRIFISLVLQATQERAAIPAKERKPVFLIVDEAADYFDTNIDDLLTDARKYKVGCVFAHQYLDQASPALRSSLAANASIKFASGVSAADARTMAGDMRTTTDFILKQPKLQFACHIRNVTPEAVSIPVEPGQFARMDQLDDDGYRRLIERNRERVSFGSEQAKPPVSTPQADYGTETAPEW